jgi:hypothetical protein
MGAGPLVVTYPLTGRSRAIVGEELGGAGAAWPFRDGLPVSRPSERDRLAASSAGGGAWHDEYLRRAVQNCRRAILGETPWNLIGSDERML